MKMEKSARKNKERTLRNFSYTTPTKILFGRDTHHEAGRLVKEYAGSKVLVHFGCKSALETGVKNAVLQSLESRGIKPVCLGSVVPNPRLSLVLEGISLCRREGVDFILAVGGGSVIDSAKAIGFGLVNDGDIWDFFSFKRSPQKRFPLGVVLTSAGSGSEMSDCAVITRDADKVKSFCDSDLGRPLFAILNPELTFSVPPYQTACGCVDILMHAMERYFSQDSMRLTDEISESIMRTVLENAPIVLKEPQNYDARANIMWAASLAQNGLAACGSSGGDWATHALANELGGVFDAVHGAALSAVWGSWARYGYQSKPDRFAQFSVNVLKVQNGSSDSEKTARAGIESLEAFFRQMGMPTSIQQLGIDLTDEMAGMLAARICGEAGEMGSIRKLGRKDLQHIYQMAR
jgi:alcohol dehydrogenase